MSRIVMPHTQCCLFYTAKALTKRDSGHRRHHGRGAKLVHWKLTMYSKRNCSILLLTHSIPSCTRVISSSLSLYVNNAVRLSLIQHCWAAIFCPGDVWCWVTSCITVKSDVASFHNNLINWTGLNHRRI